MNDIKRFLASSSFAVAGASTNPEKYGNKVLRALAKSGRNPIPINPAADRVEGMVAYKSLGELPLIPESLSVVTPPTVTRAIIKDAIALGVKNLWMQPGAEDEEGSRLAREAGLNVIDDGSCVLVALSLGG